MATISVLIASREALTTIEACLGSLERQSGSHKLEILVADCSTDGTPELISRRFPAVKLVRRQGSLNTAQLRAIALGEASGDIIVLGEPHCIFADGWQKALEEASQNPTHKVIGGAVSLAKIRGRGAWAAGLFEYVAYLPPLPAGRTAETTGNNVAYRREVLPGCAVDEELWKAFLNWELQAKNISFWAAPGMLVYHQKPFKFGHFVVQRYHYGRCFAAERVSRFNLSLGRRLFHLASVPALPVLQLKRLAEAVWPKQAYRGQFLVSLPYLLLFSCAWAWGEGWGYLAGPGRSCPEVY